MKKLFLFGYFIIVTALSPFSVAAICNLFWALMAFIEATVTDINPNKKVADKKA